MNTNQQLSGNMIQGSYTLPPLSDYVVTEIVYENVTQESYDDIMDRIFN